MLLYKKKILCSPRKIFRKLTHYKKNSKWHTTLYNLFVCWWEYEWWSATPQFTYLVTSNGFLRTHLIHGDGITLSARLNCYRENEVLKTKKNFAETFLIDSYPGFRTWNITIWAEWDNPSTAGYILSGSLVSDTICLPRCIPGVLIWDFIRGGFTVSLEAVVVFPASLFVADVHRQWRPQDGLLAGDYYK